MSSPSLEQPFIRGVIETAAGAIPRIATPLDFQDHWGTLKARWGIGRMHYTVDPGLYGVGQPDSHSPVLVSANYKMSFDRLRRVLENRSAWLLVLDTKGINVWCAAGKGSFGTAELVERLRSSGLERIVSHRRLILPQLAAPGVSAHQVLKLSGFKVVYGPIRSEDLPRFLDAGMKATPQMRIKTFPLIERAALIPVELVSALKTSVFILPALFLLGGLCGSEGFWQNMLAQGVFACLTFLGAVLAGTVLAPILLPWLPGRAFSIKGYALGFAIAVLATFAQGLQPSPQAGWIPWLAWLFLLLPSVVSYLTMNFTGCSTYTSLSGVRKEMRRAVPLQLAGVVVGLALWLGSRFLG